MLIISQRKKCSISYSFTASVGKRSWVVISFPLPLVLLRSMCLPNSTHVSSSARSARQQDAEPMQGDGAPDLVPPESACMAAHRLAITSLPRAIYNHSMRTFLHAKGLVERDPEIFSVWLSPSRVPLLFVACVLHDMGSASHLSDTSQRFEVEGADSAVSVLRQHGDDSGFTEEDVHDVWVAIALHTSSGIAERIRPLARVVREAVLVDFGLRGRDLRAVTRLAEEIEESFPRLDIEKVLSDAVVEQAERRSEKAPGGSWPGDLLRAKREDPEWKGVNRAF